MPDGGAYTQYNTNAQAALTAQTLAYMHWYDAALLVYAFACVAFAAFAFLRARPFLFAGVGLGVAGIGCQAASLGIRWYYAAHVPWNDLFGSLSVVTLFTAVLFLWFGARLRIWYAGAFVFLGADVLLAIAQYWNRGLAPLPPSLRDNAWIFIHVPVVLASYAAFLVGCATSVLFLIKRRDERHVSDMAGSSVGAAVAQSAAVAETAPSRWAAFIATLPASSALDTVTYKVIAVGEILLTTGIILGGVWAHAAWGSYWQWDPKETAALACWMIYASYLHLHTRPSWRGERAAWLSIIGFAAIIFCYFGVNIWISGLHSYK